MPSPTGLIKPVDSYIRRQRLTNTYTQYSFPDDIGPHSMIFNFSEYSFNRTNGVNATVNRALQSSIQLPLPTNLTDSYSVNISGVELDQMGAAFAQESARYTSFGDMEMREQAMQLMETVGAVSSAAVNVQLRRLLTSLDPSLGQSVSVGTGKAVNPHVALSFDGIGLKEHSFAWQFAPKTRKESDSLKAIINKFKYHIHPEYQTYTGGVGSATGSFESRTFLKFPDIVDIFFLGTEPGYLYYFKRAMVRNFLVDYTGGGAPAFLEGGKPAIFNITMSIIEQEIHTKADYEDDVYE